MQSKRNGLLELYRFILCFWPLYAHEFFFWEKEYSKFSVAELTVDFFFILSGFFLMRAMRKEKDRPVLKGFWNIIFGRVKPMLFTMCFIAAFNAVCIALFIRENYFNTLFELFKYWWFVLFLSLGIGLLYLVYRALKTERRFAIFLVILSASMTILQYVVVEKNMFIDELVFFARTLGCIPVGILISYIPMLKQMKFNVSIPIVIVLIPTLFYFAYNEKTFFVRLLMIGMFAALVYFSSNISFGSKICDLLGQLSVRIYLYMAFITMLYIFGLTHHRILFVIDLALATLDLVVSIYRQKYKALLAVSKA